MAGRAVMRDRAERWAAAKRDPEFLAVCLERCALGESVTALALEHDLPYSVFYRWLAVEHRDRLSQARQAHAAALIGRNLTAADKIEDGKLDAKRGTAATNIRAWVASRLDRDTWGDKSQVDHKHTGVVSLHVEAVRALTASDSDDDWQDADVIESEPVDDGHPLI